MRLPPFHAHPDVWLLVVVLEVGYLAALRWAAPRRDLFAERPASRGQVTSFSLGVLTLWVAADWPIHDLAERYLFSVHMTQHLLISLVAPPLLISGMPQWMLRALLRPPAIHAVVRQLTRPVVALIGFNAVIVLTHWPPFVDLAVRNELFHFGAHTLLFGAAACMWWPALSPLPEMPSLSYPGRMLYLFAQSIVPTVPASSLTFGGTVLYSYYATVPRIWDINALTDQRIAGLIMKILGGAILWGAIAVIFFRWHSMESGTEGWDAVALSRVEREIRAGLMKTPAGPRDAEETVIGR
jgi:putative membrane protein